LQETIRAKKNLGQHFLVDDQYCQRIVDLARITEVDFVIEIGPGTGQLTQHLVTRSRRVLAFEIDPDMIQLLQKRFERPLAEGRLSIVHTNILDQDWNCMHRLVFPAGEPFSPQGPTLKVVGNLPYNIATRIIQRTTVNSRGFQALVFMTQKEVAQRILADPGSKDYGYLSVWLRNFYECRRGFDVPPGAFRPQPKVYSHVFSLIPKSPSDEPVNPAHLQKLLRASFGHRRKTLRNNLASLFPDHNNLKAAFEHAGLSERVRPEQVSLDQFICMTRVLSFAQ
jgi:16S rRNA (adenine1518-N6/adenine1519-N6)-dimethyltransferase